MILRSDGPLTANEQLLDLTIRHAVYLERLKAGEVKRIVGLLNDDVIPDLLDKVQRALERIRLRGIDGAALGTQRYRDLIASLDEIAKAGMAVLRQDNAASLFDIARHESEWQVRTISTAMPKGISIELLTPDAGLLRSIVTARPMQGHLLKDWWGELAVSTRRKVTAQINMGIAEGEDVDAIVRRLRGTRAAKYTDGILQQTRHSVQSIVRTSVSHVTAHATQATLDANADIIKGQQLVATLDLRTTAICRERDGKVYKVGEAPTLPFHFGERSRYVPVLKSFKELGIPLKELPPSTRASMDGQVPETLTYYQWLAQQSAERQNEALGPARAELFRRGKLDPSKFVDAFGRELTLSELKALEARAA